MSATVSSVTDVPDPDALGDAVREYLAGVAPHFRARLGVRFDDEAMAAATLRNLSSYLPPRGRLLLASDENGALLGTCFLRMIRPDASEIKRLYLRPAARGLGLGRALADRAVAEARDMGTARVLLDTGAWMTEARALYHRMGFREIARYPESENPAEVEDLLVYMELVLPRQDLTLGSR